MRKFCAHAGPGEHAKRRVPCAAPVHSRGFSAGAASRAPPAAPPAGAASVGLCCNTAARRVRFPPGRREIPARRFGPFPVDGGCGRQSGLPGAHRESKPRAVQQPAPAPGDEPWLFAPGQALHRGSEQAACKNAHSLCRVCRAVEVFVVSNPTKSSPPPKNILYVSCAFPVRSLCVSCVYFCMCFACVCAFPVRFLYISCTFPVTFPVTSDMLCIQPAYRFGIVSAPLGIAHQESVLAPEGHLGQLRPEALLSAGMQVPVRNTFGSSHRFHA